MLKQAHEEQGVAFRLGRTPVRLEGDGRVKAVVLDDGEALAADLVVVGLGVKPATEILQGVKLNADGSVATDRRLRVTDGLYAAGDVARFPDWRDGSPIRIEHWRLAAAARPRRRPQYGGSPGGVCRGAVLLERAVRSFPSVCRATPPPGMNLSSTAIWRGAIFWPSMSRATG